MCLPIRLRGICGGRGSNQGSSFVLGKASCMARNWSKHLFHCSICVPKYTLGSSYLFRASIFVCGNWKKSSFATAIID